jgi:hypothetical protein
MYKTVSTYQRCQQCGRAATVVYLDDLQDVDPPIHVPICPYVDCQAPLESVPGAIRSVVPGHQ